MCLTFHIPLKYSKRIVDPELGLGRRGFGKRRGMKAGGWQRGMLPNWQCFNGQVGRSGSSPQLVGSWPKNWNFNSRRYESQMQANDIDSWIGARYGLAKVSRLKRRTTRWSKEKRRWMELCPSIELRKHSLAAWVMGKWGDQTMAQWKAYRTLSEQIVILEDSLASTWSGYFISFFFFNY